MAIFHMDNQLSVRGRYTLSVNHFLQPAIHV